MEEYCVNFLRSPVANRPIHLAAKATTTTLASLEMIWKQIRQILLINSYKLSWYSSSLASLCGTKKSQLIV